MYKTNELLKKLNASNKLKNANTYSISDIMFKSLAELRMLCAGVLTWDETVSLYQQAQKQRKENKLEESRILSRANPQLAKSVRLGIRSSATQRSYENLFPARASSFSKAGSVASMFSPAGYLTELYREAAALHETDSEYNLNKRRPDLGSLSLSQNNMDEEVTTLSLSSEILLNIIQPETSQDYSGVMEMLSTYRLTGNTPYHQSYENCRNAILLQDPGFNAFRTNPDVVANMDKSSLLGIEANISPELRKILIEEITEDKIDDTLKENFGVTDVTKFQDIRYLARWYGLSINELSSILGIMYLPENISPSIQYYQNNQLVILREDDGVSY